MDLDTQDAEGEWRIYSLSYVGERDGFAVELQREDHTVVLEVFQDDDTHEVTFSTFEPTVVPGSVFTAFIERARSKKILP